MNPKYRKRVGISGFRGLLYEIKLICLMYFRAFHDDTLEDFKIASNVHEIGEFGDIVIKAHVQGRYKPVAVFIQTRHKDNKSRIFTCSLAKCFHSYLEIRQQFDRSNNNSILNGSFDETECFFVIYTNATTDVPTNGLRYEGDFSAKLNDLIDTGGLVTQPEIESENLKYLYEVAMKEQMIYLAKRMAKFIHNDLNFQMFLFEEIVLRFHVILAREVFDVSEIQPAGYRIAAFRHDFFYTHDEYISIFRDTLFKEFLTEKNIRPYDLEYLIPEFLTDPTNALKLSKLIGKGTFNNGHFQINENIGISKKHRSDMKQIKISQSIEDEAVKLAAREILLNLHLTVPAAFGNKDLTMRGNAAKAERRINHLVANIVQLIEKFKPAIVITVDDSAEHGFLQLNGGIAGAIGNIFVFDDNTKLMKITDNCEQLEKFSKRLYLKLNNMIHNLHEYKFCFKFKNCPKLSFDCSQYEENLAIDFLSRLLIYANQADEKMVENILKSEIDHYQSNHENTFEAITDAIFSRYYCEMQNWWMEPKYAPCLTRTFNLFRESTNNIIKDPLMSSINLICRSKIKQYNYTFTEDAVSFLKLRDHKTTVIITEQSIPTVVKVMQQLKNTVVLDFDYIANLPIKDCYALCSELKYTNCDKVLILVCDEIKQEKTNSRNDIHCLERIAEAVENRRTIIVANQKTFKVLQKYFIKADKIYQDKKLRLVDLREESQTSMFETATAIFPGVEIKLDELLRGWPQPGSR